MSMRKLCVGLLLASAVVAISSNQALAKQFIIKDGEPKAEIVVAEKSPRMVSFAALELQYYLKKISGAKLPIVFEKSDTDNIKIYVGKSKYTDEMGINADDLKYGAFRMVSDKNSLVLLGDDFDYHPMKPYASKRNKRKKAEEIWDKKTETYTDLKWGCPTASSTFMKRWWNASRDGGFEKFMAARYGKENHKVWNPKELEWKWGKDYYAGVENGYTPGFWSNDEGGSLNAIYSFLRGLGVRWYMPGELGEVVPELKTIPLPDVNKTDKPDFKVRDWLWYNYSSFPFEHVMWARRLGMGGYYDLFGNMGHAHGLVTVHSRQEMKDKHPEYYALSRKGKRVTDYRGSGHVCYSAEGLIKETVKFARFIYDECNEPHVSVWPQDGYSHCHCDKCKNQSPSDLVFGFVDKVARELYKTHPDKIVSCGAYTRYGSAPESVEKFTPNVVVMISSGKRALLDDPVRWEKYQSNIESWKKKLAKGNIMRVQNNRFHIAGINGNIKFPVIHPRNMAKDLKYLNGYGKGECNEMSQSGGQWAAPGVDHLTVYVNARFLWDADQDLEKVLAEYYEKFYGPAAKEMREALDFAEASYSRIDKTKSGGRCRPYNVSLPTRIKFLELLHKARDVAGDTIYGQRIDVILSEIIPLEKVCEEYSELRKKGNPRDDALQIEAYNLNNNENTITYKLKKRLIVAQGPDVKTSFSVKWTEKSLTFDILCEEPDMKKVRIAENIWDGDSIVLLIESPYHSYYQIEVSPDGRIYDYDRGGRIETKWSSMADVEIEKGKDYWKAKVFIPIALLSEGAGADPMNYVVSPRIKSGHEWFFNLARRRPREGKGKWSHRKTYVLCKGGRGGRNMLEPDVFAKLVIK